MNEVRSFFYYMWNTWSREECDAVFGYLSDHIWAKWVGCCSERGAMGAAEWLYANLDDCNRDKLVGRGMEVYDGMYLVK